MFGLGKSIVGSVSTDERSNEVENHALVSQAGDVGDGLALVVSSTRGRRLGSQTVRFVRTGNGKVHRRLGLR